MPPKLVYKSPEFSPFLLKFVYPNKQPQQLLANINKNIPPGNFHFFIKKTLTILNNQVFNATFCCFKGSVFGQKCTLITITPSTHKCNIIVYKPFLTNTESITH